MLTCDRCEETILVKPSKVIIIEGIMALYRKELRDMMDLRIYVDADPDERLIRVINRDVVERGRTASIVMERYLHTLRGRERESHRHTPFLSGPGIVWSPYGIRIVRQRG